MIAGIDIGGTKVAVGLVEDQGTVVVRAEIPIQLDRGPASARDRIINVLRQQIVETGTRLTGIGIGCTGPADPITGEVGDVPTLPGWNGWNPVTELADAFSVSAALENDADAAALGEAQWGAGKGKRTLVGITVGTGIGAGIILNGEVYRGVSYSHPEIGHQIIEPDGPQCTCGARGCWERLASGPALEQHYAEQNPTDARRSGKEICELARKGDRKAQHAVDVFVRYLGIGLSNVVTMLAPEVVAFSGSVMKSSDLLLGPVRAIVRNNCRFIPVEHCEIVISSLGANAGIIGAAQVWRSRFGSGLMREEL